MTLFEAVETGDLATVRQTLQGLKDVNVLGDGGITPLFIAAERGQLPLVQALLDAGAEAQWKDTIGETAMLRAAANGHRAVVQVLLPFANDDQKDMAVAFLKAQGAPHAPEYDYDDSRLKRGAVEVAARAASFFGDDAPQARVDRLNRAEERTGKPKKK